MLVLVVGLLCVLLFQPEPHGVKVLPVWDSALATAAQVTIQATAIGFGLLVVAVANAAGRYSPTLLKYIVRDAQLAFLFGWNVFAVSYAMVALALGSTVWRVGAATVLTLMAILALGLAVWRVARLVDPIELARMVERQVSQQTASAVNKQRQQFRVTISRAESATGVRVPDALLHVPVSADIVKQVLSAIQPLLSIAGRAIADNQSDVVDGVLTAGVDIVKSYLDARGLSASMDDPVITRVSEDLFALAQSAEGAASRQPLLGVIRTLGRLAEAGVGVSAPGYGPGEDNVAGMPMSHLALVAQRNITNVHSSAAALATDELGRTILGLLDRGLPAMAAGAVDRHIAPIMINALRPLADHIAAIGARWLLVLWAEAAFRAGGDLLQTKVERTMAPYLEAYRQNIANLQPWTAIDPLLSPSSAGANGSSGPLGATVAYAIASSDWPAPSQLLENANDLADEFVRGLLWPAARGDYRDHLIPMYVAQQVAEVAALMAAVACGTMRHPKAHAETVSHMPNASAYDQCDEEIYDGHDAAEKWGWLAGVMLGSCARLKEEPSSDAVSGDRWHAYRSALDGSSSAIWAALVDIRLCPCEALEDELDKILDELSELGEWLVTNWPKLEWTNPVIQHIRMIGAWLLALGRVERATAMAELIARAAQPRVGIWGSGDPWSHRYPTETMSARWTPALISVAGQRLMPEYYVLHAFSGDDARQAFEELVEKFRTGTDPPTAGGPQS